MTNLLTPSPSCLLRSLNRDFRLWLWVGLSFSIGIGGILLLELQRTQSFGLGGVEENEERIPGSRRLGSG